MYIIFINGVCVYVCIVYEIQTRVREDHSDGFSIIYIYININIFPGIIFDVEATAIKYYSIEPSESRVINIGTLAMVVNIST